MAGLFATFSFLASVLAQGAQAQSQRAAPSSGPLPTRTTEVGDHVRLHGPGTIVSHRKIGAAASGFADTLDPNDAFGSAVTALGDLDGDGVLDLAVGAIGDDESGNSSGAVWVLFLDGDGAVARQRKISAAQGGFSANLDGADFFGSAVAALGDLDGDGVLDLAVGAIGDDDGSDNAGAVWVLFLDVDGTVKGHQKISATVGGFGGVLEEDDRFGTSVTCLGDVDGDGVVDLAVGAAGDDDGASNDGAVYVLFLDTDGTVRAEQKISATEGGFGGSLSTQNRFGTSVAALDDLDGDGKLDLAVGALNDHDGGLFRGAVWVLFLDDDGTVQAHQKISSTHGGFGGTLSDVDLFGSSLAPLGDLDGDGVLDLAVGAPGSDLGLSVRRGAVWVLFLDSDGTVKDQRKIGAAQGGFTGDLDGNDEFGVGAAPGDFDGDGAIDLVVGAPGDDDGELDRGAVWQLHLDSDGTVASHVKISTEAGGFADTLDPGDAFGSATVGLGDMDAGGTIELAVGAPGDDDGGSGTGAVWVLFTAADGSVASHRKISATQGGFAGSLDPLDSFGASLATLGKDGGTTAVAVGAPGDDDAGDRRGALWVLSLDSDGAVEGQQKISALAGGFAGDLADGDQFGSSLAALGDLDGDGAVDLAVGSPGDDDGGSNRGAVWVLLLHSDGTVKGHQKISAFEGSFAGDLHNGDRFGGALAALGDLDGDGVGDLAVGAGEDDEGGSNRGAVWVLLLHSDGTVKAHQKIGSAQGDFTGDLSDADRFGSSLATLGELDGDGIVDLAVGAPGDDDGGNDRGAVWVLLLDSDGTVAAHQKISDTHGEFTGDLDNRDAFGSGTGALGDLDGDGVLDLVTGAPLDDDGGPDHGALWLLQLDGIATIGFEVGDDASRTALVNGQDVSSPPEFGRTLVVASSGANLGPAIFDSTRLGPNDPSQDRDLLVGLGNLLILQNSQAPTQTVPDVFDRPNDDQDGGTFTLTFHAPVEPLSLDLVDIDHGTNQGASATLFDSAGRQRVYTVPMGWTEDLLADGPPAFRTLDLRTLDPQPGFASIATAAEATGFDRRAVVRIDVHLGSSGAVDGLRWDPHPD